eukprot:6206423-Pleurochrysis_carterae.AAC.5
MDVGDERSGGTSPVKRTWRPAIIGGARPAGIATCTFNAALDTPTVLSLLATLARFSPLAASRLIRASCTIDGHADGWPPSRSPLQIHNSKIRHNELLVVLTLSCGRQFCPPKYVHNDQRAHKAALDARKAGCTERASLGGFLQAKQSSPWDRMTAGRRWRFQIHVSSGIWYFIMMTK